MGKSKSFWTSQWCMNKIASCITYDDVSTCIKVHQDAGLVAPCLLIGQCPEIKASDWSPLVAKYTVKDAGGLSPPAGSRWLRSLSRPAEEGVIAPSNRVQGLSSPKWFNPKHCPALCELPGAAWRTLSFGAKIFSVPLSLSLFSQPGPSWCQWCTQGASYPAANQRRVLVTLTNERPPSAGYFPSLFTQHWRPKRGAVTVKNTGNSLVIDDNIAISGRCVIARLPLLPIFV